MLELNKITINNKEEFRFKYRFLWYIIIVLKNLTPHTYYSNPLQLDYGFFCVQLSH